MSVFAIKYFDQLGDIFCDIYLLSSILSIASGKTEHTRILLSPHCDYMGNHPSCNFTYERVQRHVRRRKATERRFVLRVELKTRG